MKNTTVDEFFERKLIETKTEKENFEHPSHDDYLLWMEEYAEIKMTEILVIASNEARIKIDSDGEKIVDKDSILNAMFVEEVIGRKIEFIESHSFCGESYYVKVDENLHNLTHNKKRDEKYEDLAVKVLKTEYGIDYDSANVLFKWDGCL